MSYRPLHVKAKMMTFKKQWIKISGSVDGLLIRFIRSERADVKDVQQDLLSVERQEAKHQEILTLASTAQSNPHRNGSRMRNGQIEAHDESFHLKPHTRPPKP